MVPANYTREEERRAAEDMRAGRTPTCPRCGAAMSPRPVPPPPEVSYVRDRVWLMCSGCRRSMVLDRPDETP